MKKNKIVIAEGLRPPMYRERLVRILSEIGDDTIEVVISNACDEAGVMSDAHDADVVIVRPGLKFGSRSISELCGCRGIVSLAMGYDHIDIKAAASRGIPVFNIPDYGTEEVADTAFSLLLGLVRKTDFYNCSMKNCLSKWDWKIGVPIRRTRGMVLGIIGLGRIGTAVALRAKAFGFNIMYYDPYKEDGYDKVMGVVRLEMLHDLLRNSDVVTIHVPLTVETTGFIDEEFLSNMKKGSILINTARGALFNNMDVVEKALKENWVYAVATDVLLVEPPVNEHSLFKVWRNNEAWIAGRFVITPHMAFYSEESCYELCSKALKVAVNVSHGNLTGSMVNSELLKGDENG